MTFIGWNGFFKKKRAPLGIFFLVYMALAFLTYKDYGITWDEYDSLTHAGKYLKHYFHMNDQEVEQKQVFDREQATHNYVYPALERVFTPKILAAEKIHLFNMVFAFLAFWALFELLLDALKDPWWALLGPVFLYSCLRFSGDIPGDPKDMPFAVLFILSLAGFYFHWRWSKMIVLWDISLGILIGSTSCIRVLGLTLFPIFILWRLWVLWQRQRSGPSWLWNGLKQEAPRWAIVLIVSQVWMMLLWPYLGQDYFGHFREIFKLSTNYYWDGPMLFMGRTILGSDRLWYYLPIWFSVALPVLILVLFPYSVRAYGRLTEGPLRGLVALSFIALAVNGTLYLGLRPVVYNAFRLYLFLVPVFCLLAAVGSNELWSRVRRPLWRGAIVLLVGSNMFLVLVQFVQLYPYQYVYFNEMAGGFEKGSRTFDADYWGPSLKEASQWLVRHELTDPQKIYRVRTCGSNWQQAYYFPSNVESDTHLNDPDYRILLAYYEVLYPEDSTRAPELAKKVIHVVEREGVPLAYVLKMK